MKILTVSDVSMLAVIGGAERVLHEQCIRLARMGHSLHVLTRRLPEHRPFRECIRGVTEWRFPVTTRDPFSFFITSFFNSLRLFRSLEKQYGFDCIHFHQPLSAVGVLFSPLSRKIRTRSHIPGQAAIPRRDPAASDAAAPAGRSSQWADLWERRYAPRPPCSPVAPLIASHSGAPTFAADIMHSRTREIC